MADDLPWHHFTSPLRQWSVLPTFLVGLTVHEVTAR